jgi:thymidylate synthase (FAD)
MTVNLIWATSDADAMIARIARVSNPANEGNAETAPRLIRYLIRHRHWSPFEMAGMCVEIYAPRDVGRQLLRHRSFTFQEFSQRYAATDALPPAPFVEARMQHPTNRQASVWCDDEAIADGWKRNQQAVMDASLAAYEWALSVGIAKEVARSVLPEGLTMSRLYMTGNIRSWLHFCDLRRGHGTQPETQEVAEECWRILREVVPATVEAWETAA